MRFGETVLFQPDAGCCNADATVAALQRRAAAHGAVVRTDAGAVVVEPSADGVLVRTDDGDYRSTTAVIACGPWAPKVLAGLVELPPLLVTREQVFYFTPDDADLIWPSFIHHRSPYIYGLDTPGMGVKVAEHHTGFPTDADERSFDVDAEGRRRVLRYVQEWFPGLRPEPVAAETCLYTTTSTADFVIDRAGPLTVAAGFSGHGFKFTPLIGRLVADLALVAFGPRQLRAEGDAEALAQEAFLRAWASWDRYSTTRPFWPWVSTIARRLCIDHGRQQQRARARGIPTEDVAPTEPDEAILALDEYAWARAALAALQPNQQRVLQLREVDRWSYDRIASHEGVSVEAVRGSLKRSRQALRAAYLRLADWTPVVVVLAAARGIGRRLSDQARRTHMAVAVGGFSDRTVNVLAVAVDRK